MNIKEITIAERQQKLAEKALIARREQASPVGPRLDEWKTTKPTEERSGINPHSSVGPEPQQWQAPAPGYRWQSGKDNAEHLVYVGPAPVSVPRAAPVVLKRLFARTSPKVVDGWRERTSSIGMKTLKDASPACGPHPVLWVDPKK